MIARLSGRLAAKGPTGVVVDVGGVGYEVFVSLQTLARLPEIEGAVELLVHTNVREDAIQLYGFEEALERRLFLLLKEVSGIGPRLALNILSGLPVEDLLEAIGAGEVGRLVLVPGVGKKTAERIVVELREKVAPLVAELAGRPGDGLAAEAVSALVNLGYRRPEAEAAVRSSLGNGRSLEEVIRDALQVIAS